MIRVVASPLAEKNKSLQWGQRMAMARQSFRREDILDAAALLVELAAVGSGASPLGPGWEADVQDRGLQLLAQPVGIIGLVAQKPLTRGNSARSASAPLVRLIACGRSLPFRTLAGVR